MEEIKRAQEQRVDEVSVQNWRSKSWDNTKAHFTIAANARTNEFHEWFRRISRSGIKLQWEVVLRFQSTCNDSEFSFHAEPRQTLANRHTESIWITGKRFCKSIFYVWFNRRLFSKDSVWRRAKKSRSRPWSRKDEDQAHKWRQTKSRHNSNADICNKAVGFEFYNTGGITAERHDRTAKTAISELQFDKFTNPQSFLCGKFDSKPKSLPVLIFHRMLCCGSKKWRWSIHWTD